MSAAEEEPLFVAVTVDIDPDANRPAPGRSDAVSAGHTGGEAKFDACFEGLRALLGLLEEMSLPATLFWEARTLQELTTRRGDLMSRLLRNRSIEHGCHGYRHEDFAGTESGLRLGLAETRATLERAGQIFASVIGTAPRAFRAPYCRLTGELITALDELGYLYDASVTWEPSPEPPAGRRRTGGDFGGGEWCLRPYRLEGASGLWELALCRPRDRRGKRISTYLWQLFEGNRSAKDYLDLMEDLRRDYAGGLMQIALHPWHLIVAQDGSPLSRLHHSKPADQLRLFLKEAARMRGIAFTTAGAYLETAVGGQGPQ